MHVPYKGTGQSVADTVAGHIQMMFSAIASAVPHVKSGRLVAIAVTSPKRIAPLPDGADADRVRLRHGREQLARA